MINFGDSDMKQKNMLDLYSLLLTTSALAEINISGFTSVIGGQVHEGLWDSTSLTFGIDVTF